MANTFSGSPEDVVEEIGALQEDFICLVDDEFLMPRGLHVSLNTCWNARIKRNYFSWARSDIIVKHPEVFKLWGKGWVKCCICRS